MCDWRHYVQFFVVNFVAAAAAIDVLDVIAPVTATVAAATAAAVVAAAATAIVLSPCFLSPCNLS